MTLTTAAGVTALGWGTIDFPTQLTATLTSYVTVASIVSELGLFSADLSTFFTYCATAQSCQYDAYSTRYDGLALGHWIDLVAASTAVTFTYDGSNTKIAGHTPSNLPAAAGLCDATTFVCFGWYLDGGYTNGIDSNTSTTTLNKYATFYSGVYYAAFAALVPTATHVLDMF